MTQKSEIGRIGEDMACRYLVEKGYKVIDRNFRKPWGELDIIAKAPDKTLVFVEVKTVQQSLPQTIQQNSLETGDSVVRQSSPQAIGRWCNGGNEGSKMPAVSPAELHYRQNQTAELAPGQIEPEMQMTPAKMKKLKRTASLYSGHYPELIKEDKGWRIDLIAIIIPAELLTIKSKDCLIRHYENVVAGFM